MPPHDPARRAKAKKRLRKLRAAAAGLGVELEGARLLDVGAGRGELVLEALLAGIDARGVELQAGKVAQFRAAAADAGGPPEWAERVLCADAAELPQPTAAFDVVHSWYVLEHVADLSGVLREMVRVLRPGGALVLVAQDARLGWDGHAKIPWPPFLPARLHSAWAEVFEAELERRDGVQDVTAPQVSAILEALGCTIHHRGPEPSPLIPDPATPRTIEETRALAEATKRRLGSGAWDDVPESLVLHATRG